jgi:uncharacterized protein YjbI with pentapeptide repeats
VKYEIKNRWGGTTIYADEAASFRALVEAAVKSRADLSRANLYGADLSGANLSRADLSGANLSRADLSGAEPVRGDLSRADLSGANLSGADLSGANLSRADLSGANLSRADLSGANLSRADLSGADLSGANLYGFFSFGPGGSRNAYTWARWEEGGYTVHCGCQILTLKDFAAAVKKTHGSSDRGKWYAANIKTMALVAKTSEKAYRERQKAEKPKPTPEAP